MFPLWCEDDDEWYVQLSCVLCLLWFPMQGLERSPKSQLTVMLCALSSFPHPNGLERCPFTECDIWVTGVLKGIQNSLCRMVMKELIFSKEVSHEEWKHCLSDAGVLKWVQDLLCEIVLKEPILLKEVSHEDLTLSLWWMFPMESAGVFKGVNLNSLVLYTNQGSWNK